MVYHNWAAASANKGEKAAFRAIYWKVSTERWVSFSALQCSARQRPTQHLRPQ